MVRTNAILVCLLTFFLALSVQAEQAETFGSYTIHYNAFTTDNLTPEIAKNYNIPRSRNRALLNISVLKKMQGSMGIPVKADINATATNLNSQLKQLEFREHIEPGDPGAVYYLAETLVNHGETLTYTIKVTPEGNNESHTFTYKRQFVTE